MDFHPDIRAPFCHFSKKTGILKALVTFIFWGFLAFSDRTGAQSQPLVLRHRAMGTNCTITLYSTDSLAAERAAQKAFQMLDSFELILSDYNPQSEASRAPAAGTGKGGVRVSPVLFELTQKSLQAAELSGGVFDITISPVIKLWRAHKKAGNPPSKKEIKSRLRSCGYQYLKADSLTQRLFFLKEGMGLDFGGIAQGYAAQKMLDYLKSKGFPITMVDIGGDIACGEKPPGTAGWEVAVNLPGSPTELYPETFFLENQAITTSGKLFNYFEYRGKKYSHIIHPRTGQPVRHNRQSTVIAPDGATADWLATLSSTLGS